MQELLGWWRKMRVYMETNSHLGKTRSLYRILAGSYLNCARTIFSSENSDDKENWKQKAWEDLVLKVIYWKSVLIVPAFMKKLSLRINQTNRLVSQQFYFLETRKFSYLRLSRGANFSSFKITKLHVLLYEISWTKVYLWLTFALSVCLQELWWSRFGRVAVFSWRRVGSSDLTLY